MQALFQLSYGPTQKKNKSYTLRALRPEQKCNAQRLQESGVGGNDFGMGMGGRVMVKVAFRDFPPLPLSFKDGFFNELPKSSPGFLLGGGLPVEPFSWTPIARAGGGGGVEGEPSSPPNDGGGAGGSGSFD